MARKSSGRLSPIGLGPRVTERRNRPSVHAFPNLWCILKVNVVPPGPPIGSLVSNVAQWITPVAG